jgi:cell division transport system ATP-binding protein
MIEFQQVSKRYPGGREALSEVSFALSRGELSFLTGHSGAGKSTLLRLIIRREKPTRGQVLFDGLNLGRLPDGEVPRLRRRIGMVFQDHRLLSDRTVFDNVALPLAIIGLTHAEIAKRVRAALDKVGLLNRERSLPLTLSAGEQQRVGIARAVVHRPDLLLADEPTGNLDPELAAEVMGLFEQFRQVGVTVLIASHDHALIARLGQRVLTLHEGRLEPAPRRVTT